MNGVLVNPASFRVPGGPVIPGLAILIAMAILVGATSQQLQAGAWALVAGAALYFIAVRSARTR